MSNEAKDPLNINNNLSEEEVKITYRPYDRYTEIAEGIVSKWVKYIKIIGMIKGELGFSDELVMIIAEELRKECNDITKKDSNEKTGNK